MTEAYTPHNKMILVVFLLGLFFHGCHLQISPGATGTTATIRLVVVSSNVVEPTDPCATGTDDCMNGFTTCTAVGANYVCTCNTGLTGSGKGPNGCTDIDECANVGSCSPNANCKNSIGNYTCTCKTGYSGDGTSCTDINECLISSTCDVNANCQNLNGTYFCTCKDGFTADFNTCIDKNECSTPASNKCVLPATCQNTIGSFDCLCPAGFESNGNFACQDINECNNATLNDCDANADCTNTVGAFTCACKNGFTGNGKTCADVNECATTQSCDRNAQCQNSVGSFSCVCNTGYEGSGLQCTDVDECTNSSNKCGLNQCLNIPGSYVCICRAGYVNSGAFDCLDQNECLTPNICPTISVCENSIGSYKCVCNSGYEGNTCQDINECVSSPPCDANANCTNLPGSFSCQCKNGFQGNGATCTNINECQQSNNCDKAADCIDTIGSYTCQCRAGYTGNGFTCSDNNECNTGTHSCNQTCTNIPGSYQCSCNSGYTLVLPNDCADINECSSSNLNNCNQNATCTNTDGSFTCACNSGFLGNGVDCAADNFSPYTQCSYITNADVGQPIVRVIDVDGFPLSGALHHTIYVCVNGFVSLGEDLCEQSPSGDLGTPIGSGPIFAPYWADIDTSIPAGVVTESNRIYYCHYDSNANNADAVNVRAKVQATVLKSGVSFTPLNVFTATWFEVSPYPATSGNNYFNSTNKATFQLVMASDGANTYVYFVYYNMMWNDPASIFNVQMGYQYNPTESFTPNVPQPYSRLRFEKAVGNVGQGALWSFQVSTQRQNQAALECNTWLDTQPTAVEITALQRSSRRVLRRMTCPCAIQQAVFDSRFSSENSLTHSIVRSRLNICYGRQSNPSFCSILEGLTYCVQRRNIWYLNLQDSNGNNYYVVTRCCYAADTGSLITTVSSGDSPLTQNYLTAPNPQLSRRALRRQRVSIINTAISSTITPFQKCCKESAKCSEYQSRTRTPLCRAYRPQGRSASFGDPHLVTLDGLAYTFNGLGDYILVNSSVGLQVHSRTCRVMKDNTPQRATVFCGFALTEPEEPVFQLYYNSTMMTPIFLVDGESKNYKNSTTYGTTEVTYANSTNSETVTLAFLSGNSIEIQITPFLIQAAVSASDDIEDLTVGLLGVYNLNKSDDFTARDGTVLSITSSEQDIYNNFGQTWRVLSNEALFTEPLSDTALYTPLFFTNLTDLFNYNQTAVDNALSICGDPLTSRECFFDLALSGNMAVAVTGQEFSNSVESIRTLTNLSPPFVSGPSVRNVTIGNPETFFIQTNSTGNLTYFINTNHTSSFILLNNKTGEVSFTPTTMDEEIRIGVTDDDTGLSAFFQPHIYFCDCAPGGKCDYSSVQVLDAVSNPFISVFQCTCSDGYSGPNCKTEVDPCNTTPCYANVTCSANITGFIREAQCAQCPTGYHGDGRKCYDIDECGVLKPCEQTCENAVASFSCGCNPGYSLFNQTHCEDVNECNNTSTCKENEKCENTIGSHICNCASGFRANSSAVCADIDECAEFTDDCQQNCINVHGSYNCSCASGYNLDANGKTCNDVNECTASLHNCVNNATCTNVLGSFECHCDKGFTGNGSVKCNDVDECGNGEAKCQQTCNNTIGSFVCMCNETHVLSADGVTCNIKVNPCLTSTNNCDGNATCAFQGVDYTCTCNSGYSGDGTSCIDIDECQSNRGGCSQTCVNTPGLFECQCGTGYTLDADGKTCNNINECIFSQDNCTAVGHSKCVDTVGSFDCTCNSGYEKNGGLCKDIDECAVNTSGCSQICTNNAGSFQCSCQAGYSLQGGKQCVNNNECVLNTDDCHANATCTDTVGSFSCQCRNGFTGNGKTCQNINECANSNICDMLCIDLPGSYRCSCRPGYLLGQDGRTCTDINECLLGTSNCTTNQTCFNENGSFKCRSTCLQGNCEQLCNDTSTGYKCYCGSGYQPKASDASKCDNINECSQPSLNTCVSDSTCVDTNGSYVCQCNQGFSGDGNVSCSQITTSAPYTTALPNQVKVLNGNISLFDANLDNAPVDLTNQATLTALSDPTSQLYQRLKAAIEAALLIKFQLTSATSLNVEVISITVVQNSGSVFAITGPYLDSQYWVRFQESFNQDPSAVANSLRTAIAQDNNKITSTALTASVDPTTVVLADVNECVTSLHRCHSNAQCTDTQQAYTCACNVGYNGDGFSCTATGGGTDTLVAVLATVAVGFLILIILLVWFLVVRKRRRQRKPIPENDSVSSVDGASWTPFPFGQMRARSMYVPSQSVSRVVPTQYRDIPHDQT